MQFDYELVAEWPKLAWEVTCNRGAGSFLVRHGSGVETRPSWFCEAAWDGPFSDGGFDQTDIVIGSGGRLRDGRLAWVSAGNTVDRLQALEIEDGYRISNSLACLYAGGGIELDPAYPHYYSDFRTVTQGLRKLKDRVHTRQGTLWLHYFHNLVWDGKSLTRQDKPDGTRNFSTFADYHRFLASAVGSLAANGVDQERKRQKFVGLGTISSGYDSTAVATVARQVGAIDQVMTFVTGRSGRSDDGSAVARNLGLAVVQVERETYRDLYQPEVPFLSSNAYGEEVHFSGAEDLLANRILYTGFHGDKMWAKEAAATGPDIVRSDPTGLALSEYRLQAGFLHCPVPFFGVRQIADVHRLSNSPEMGPWDIPGDYSRPICRRIVEEAGGERSSFGQEKNAASVTMFNPRQKFLTSASLNDFLAWLDRTPSAPSSKRYHVERMLRGLISAATVSRIKIVPDRVWSGMWRRSRPLFYHLFPWAVERASEAYRRRA